MEEKKNILTYEGLKKYEDELEYLKDDVERMLKHYKKQIKIKEELNKDNPICLR